MAMIDLNAEINKSNTPHRVALLAIQDALLGKTMEGGKAFAFLSEMGYGPEDVTRLIGQMKSI